MKIQLITFLIFSIGLGFLCYSLTMKYYKDQKAADDLLANSFNINKEDYYKKETELRTNKTTFMDLGAGISIASGTIFLFLLLTKTRTFSDFKNLKTFNRLAIFLSSNIVWLLLIPDTFLYYTFRGQRGDYPPFADSIGIGIYMQVPLFLFLLIPLNIFIFLTTFKTDLPTKLFMKAENYDRPVILWEIFFSFWLLINFFCFIVFVIDGDHISILVNLFFTFVLLNLRAGKINKYNKHLIN